MLYTRKPTKTYELEYYYADLAHLSYVSPEERQHRVTSLMEQKTPLDEQARNQLVEAYLPLAIKTALKQCPPTYDRLLPDIIGEVSLALVKATRRFDGQHVENFASYVIVYVNGAIKKAIGEDRVLKVPSSTLSLAKQRGTDHFLYQLQPTSFDACMQRDDSDHLQEPLATPLLPPNEAPARDPALRVHVQNWLASLPPRAQEVLTLRYGLSDEDERCLTLAEVARTLHLEYYVVRSIERNALLRLRALVTEAAKNGTLQVPGISTCKLLAASKQPLLTPEQEALFMQTAQRICAQGKRATGRLLAQETGLSVKLALVFLRLHRNELPLVASAKPPTTDQERLASLAQAYSELSATGKRVAFKQLARAAHVNNGFALKFLQAQKREQEHAG